VSTTTIRRTNDSDTSPDTDPVPAARTPEEIAAAAAEAIAAPARAARRADAIAWRELVRRIADGAEPDGEDLRGIGELTVRLALPQGALARDVGVLREERKLRAICEKATADADAADAARPALQAEYDACAARLERLRVQLVENYHVAHYGRFVPARLGQFHEANRSILWDDEEV
jgi:hypothetical protein